MNDLISYLLNYAFRHGIGYQLIHVRKDFKSCAIPERNFMIINTNVSNKYELPFIIGHEIGHLMNHDDVVDCYAPTVTYYFEREADKFSLGLIFNYALQQGNMIREPQLFIHQFGIPQRMLNQAMKLFLSNRRKIQW